MDTDTKTLPQTRNTYTHTYIEDKHIKQKHRRQHFPIINALFFHLTLSSHFLSPSSAGPLAISHNRLTPPHLRNNIL